MAGEAGGHWRASGTKQRNIWENEKNGERTNERREHACKRSEEAREELRKKISELRKHQDKETELQKELRMLREERKRTENETLRNHTVQIEQLEAKARLECAEMRKELEKQAQTEL